MKDSEYKQLEREGENLREQIYKIMEEWDLSEKAKDKLNKLINELIYTEIEMERFCNI